MSCSRTSTAAAAAIGLLLVVSGAATAAAPSPLGLWKAENGRLYRWVAVAGGGFEERSLTAHRTESNHCLVAKNAPVYRYAPAGGGVYKVTSRYWRKDCTSHWDQDETIKIVVTPTRMTHSCDGEFTKVCWRYTRVQGDVRPPKVHALASRGTAGGDTSLRYTVSDDSGRTWDELTIYSGSKVIRRYKTTPGPAKVGRLYGYKLKETPEDFAGTYRFCVRARDAAGNTSAQSCAALVIRSAAEAANAASIELAVGDAVLVTGTRIGCYAITSNGKNGMACVLLAKDKPIAGSFGAGLAVDGTAVVTRVKADGSGQQVFKRRLQASPHTYRVGAGEGFGLRISATVNLGCGVIDVTSTLVEPLYRGRKVSCWRATATAPLPGTYGVSLSDKLAGVFRFDAKSRVTTWGFVRRQPAA